MANVRSLMLIAAIAAVSAACDHKELCFDHSDHAPRYEVEVRAGWELAWEFPYNGGTNWQAVWNEAMMGREYVSLNPAVPEGLRVVAYRDGTRPDEFNIPAQGAVVSLQPGWQSLLFYNNDFEYVTINNEGSYVEAMATTRSRARRSYSRTDEFTVAPPDMFFGNWIDRYENLPGPTADVINVTMHPLTFTYVIRYEFSAGINYVMRARGALAGMASGVYLHSGINSEAPATLLYDCTVEPWGVEAVVKSFGLPGFPNRDYSRTDPDFILNLELLLKNGNTLSFDVDVSAQVAAQPYGGVIVAGPFEVDENQGGDSAGSGFEIDVDDWGEDVDVDINI